MKNLLSQVGGFDLGVYGPLVGFVAVAGLALAAAVKWLDARTDKVSKKYEADIANHEARITALENGQISARQTLVKALVMVPLDNRPLRDLIIEAMEHLH